METMPFIIFSPVLSHLAIIYKLQTMVCFINTKLHKKTFINKAIINDCYSFLMYCFYCVVYFLYLVTLQLLLCCHVTRSS